MHKLYQNSLWAKNAFDYPNKEVLIELYKKLSDEERNSELGQSIRIEPYPPTAVQEGEDMIDGELFDLNGQLQHLANYKGEYLLLDFWAASCIPCRRRFPR